MTTPSIRRSLAAKAIDLPPGYAAVEDLMRALVKALRAQQLYAANNPMHKSALDALRAAFTPVWVETPELVLTINETELHWMGVPVLVEVKSSDNLAWLLYKDGLRELRFTSGVEENDIVRFLEIIVRARKASVDDDDLITMLWEAELTGITYGHTDPQADDGVDPQDVKERGPAGPPAAAGDVRAGTQQAQAEATTTGVVNMADFDTTLHFLDPKEIDYLRQEIAREYEQDLRTNIVAALFDVFEQQTIDTVREEVLDHIETMLAFLLASGGFHGVAYLLGETAIAADRAGDLSPQIKSRISTLADRLSTPEAVGQLMESLDDAAVLPPKEELALLFAQLRPTALGTVFAWLPRVRAEQLRALVTEVAGRLAMANTGVLVSLIESPDYNVSDEAMRRAGGLKAQAAVAPMAKILAAPDAKRRQIAALALAQIGSTGAMHALERCLTDPDRDVRVTTVRAIAAQAYRPAAARLEPIIKGKEIRDADLTEKMAFFEGYGAVAGDAGVPYLDGVLNGKGFLGKREDSSVRGAAAAGLGRIGTAKARESLQRAGTDKDPVVRNAVSRALRGPTP